MGVWVGVGVGVGGMGVIVGASVLETTCDEGMFVFVGTLELPLHAHSTLAHTVRRKRLLRAIFDMIDVIILSSAKIRCRRPNKLL